MCATTRTKESLPHRGQNADVTLELILDGQTQATCENRWTVYKITREPLSSLDICICNVLHEHSPFSANPRLLYMAVDLKAAVLRLFYRSHWTQNLVCHRMCRLQHEYPSLRKAQMCCLLQSRLLGRHHLIQWRKAPIASMQPVSKDAP